MNPTAAPRLGAWAVSGGAAADPTVQKAGILDMARLYLDGVCSTVVVRIRFSRIL